MKRILLIAATCTALPACDLNPAAAEPRLTGLCNGVSVDTSGTVPASASLQACIDATPDGGVLELPAGVYSIDRQLLIEHPMTLRTAGAEGRMEGCTAADSTCAILRASSGFRRVPEPIEHTREHNGLLYVRNTSHVTLEHIVIDGNRSARLGSNAALQCSYGKNRFGFNAAVHFASHVRFRYSASVNALCGTGLEWFGDDAVVERSLFQDNGDGARESMWADGLTLLQSDRGRVTESRFLENSDIGLVVGGAVDGRFSDNVVVQEERLAFAGLMTMNFNLTTSGDFTGAIFERNVVYCAPRRCNFGIMAGGHPWLPGLPSLIGGTLRDNTVFGGLVGINVDGSGTAARPTHLYGNRVHAVSPFRVRCLVTGERLVTASVNIAADAVVDRHGETAPVAATTWHQCDRFAVEGPA